MEWEPLIMFGAFVGLVTLETLPPLWRRIHDDTDSITLAAGIGFMVVSVGFVMMLLLIAADGPWLVIAITIAGQGLVLAPVWYYAWYRRQWVKGDPHE